MELFMIKTGFYEIATRKEAERRALAVWAREEQARLRMERRQRIVSQAIEPRYLRPKMFYYLYSIPDISVASSIDRTQLLLALQDLRAKEKATGQALEAEKKAIKEKLKQLP
jgi:hypothetical protein